MTVCMDAVKGRCARDPCRYFHPPLHLQAQIKAAQTRSTAVWLIFRIHTRTHKDTFLLHTQYPLISDLALNYILHNYNHKLWRMLFTPRLERNNFQYI